ncbi:MAG TPA: PilN domain-containing protein [Gemmatimonadales bacterium]
MMISVNLRPGTRRGKRRPSFAFSLDRLKGLGSAVKDPLRLVAMLAWVAAAGFLGWMYLSTGSQLGELEPKLEETRSEHRRFQDFLAQKRREEVARDSILSQIRTIRQVDGDRYIWPHILNEVAQALPPLTWLINVSYVNAPLAAPLADSTATPPPPPVQLQLTGRTVDIQGYTRFMRQLEDSPWLIDVTAISANTVVESGRAVTAFVLTATFGRPPADRIQTVSVSESVVR